MKTSNEQKSIQCGKRIVRATVLLFIAIWFNWATARAEHFDVNDISFLCP